MEEPTYKQVAFATRLGIPQPEEKTKEELMKLIDEKTGKTTSNKFGAPVMPSKSDSKEIGVYTSYAKDIFIALLPFGREAIVKDEDITALMSTAIKLVNQAREAFS